MKNNLCIRFIIFILLFGTSLTLSQTGRSEVIVHEGRIFLQDFFKVNSIYMTCHIHWNPPCVSKPFGNEPNSNRPFTDNVKLPRFNEGELGTLDSITVEITLEGFWNIRMRLPTGGQAGYYDWRVRGQFGLLKADEVPRSCDHNEEKSGRDYIFSTSAAAVGGQNIACRHVYAVTRGDPNWAEYSSHFIGDEGHAPVFVGLVGGWEVFLPQAPNLELSPALELHVGRPIGGVVRITYEYTPKIPLCKEYNASDEQIDQAIETAMQQFAEPWGQDYDEVLKRASEILGCKLKIEGASKKAPEYAVNDCDFMYCPGVNYCGPGNSSKPACFPFPCSIVIGVSESLNKACFKHDVCYDDICVKGGCYFSNEGEVSGCDQPFLDACSNNCNGECSTTLDRMVCSIGRKLGSVLVPRPGLCSTPMCPNGEVCEIGSGQCRPTAAALSCGFCIAGSDANCQVPIPFDLCQNFSSIRAERCDADGNRNSIASCGACRAGYQYSARCN